MTDEPAPETAYGIGKLFPKRCRRGRTRVSLQKLLGVEVARYLGVLSEHETTGGSFRRSFENSPMTGSACFNLISKKSGS